MNVMPRRGMSRCPIAMAQATEPIPPAGQNAAFQLSQPKGFKVGTYKVVVFLGKDSADAKVFVVKK
jgi:hypothetical protein